MSCILEHESNMSLQNYLNGKTLNKGGEKGLFEYFDLYNFAKRGLKIR